MTTNEKLNIMEAFLVRTPYDFLEEAARIIETSDRRYEGFSVLFKNQPKQGEEEQE